MEEDFAKKWTDAHARIRDAVFDICITIRETFQKCIKESNQTSYHSDILVTSQQQQKNELNLIGKELSCTVVLI